MMQIQIQVQFIDKSCDRLCGMDGTSSSSVDRCARPLKFRRCHLWTWSLLCLLCCTGCAHDPQRVQQFVEETRRHQVDKMVEQFLTHDRWDARCVSGTGAEYSGDCRETVGTEAVQTIEKIEKIEKTVEGTPGVILASGGGCAFESQCRVLVHLRSEAHGRRL